MFTNVTSSAGLNYTGRCWGASWGDFNDDGFPDLWTSKHNSHITTPGAEDVTLYVNQQDGTFRKATLAELPKVLKDFHQGIWADYDNDGDQDMMETTGSTSKGGLTLFRNEQDANGNHTLVDRSAYAALDATNKLVGRGVLMFDYNNDGLLDAFIGADARSDGRYPATIMKQLPNHTFVDARDETGIRVTSSVGPMLSDLNGDGHPELILTQYGAIQRIYDTTTLPFTDVKNIVLGNLNIPKFNDMAIADFNNDGRPDFYLTRSGLNEQVVVNGDTIRSWIIGGGPKSMTFDTTGSVKFTFSNQDSTMDYSTIYVGSQGLNLIPNDGDATKARTFTLDPTDPDSQGIKPHGNKDVGVYIGYDTSTGHWDYQVALGARVARGVLIESNNPISNLQTQGIVADAAPAADQILINTTNVPSNSVGTPAFTRFADRSDLLQISGLSIGGQNLAVGDFDNDGDVDIYIDQSGPAYNRPNVFLQNQGFGKFVPLDGSVVGASGSPLGDGGSVAAADYDRDGSLDLALLNGCGTPPFNPLNNDGPLQLFHNDGNNNAWIEMRLHGLGAGHTNADGIGARVLVTTGTKVQMREAIGGQSLDGQDSGVIHFGLGNLSGTITKIEVHWPSGATTILNGVQPRQFLDVYEPSAALNTPGTGSMHADAGDGAAAAHAGHPAGDLDILMSFDHGSADNPTAGGDPLAMDLGGATAFDLGTHEGTDTPTDGVGDGVALGMAFSVSDWLVA